MTGYFARLTARAQGAPPAARPRPWAGFAEDFPREPAEDAAPDLVNGSDPAGQLRSSAGDPVAQAGAARVGQHGNQHRSRPDAQPAVPAQSPSTEISPQSAMTYPSTRSRLALPDRSLDSQPGNPSEPSAQPTSVGRTRRHPPAGEPVPSRPARTAPLAPSPVAPTTLPSMPAALGSIHVKIGRVDVRTSVVPSPSPAPAPRPVAEPKVLSLHDYLHGERTS